MSQIDTTTSSGLHEPPFSPQFSTPVRLACVAAIIILALAFLYVWPIPPVRGIMQPAILALGLSLVQWVIEIPFRNKLLRLVPIAVFGVAVVVAWLSWFTDGDLISDDTATLVWKVISLGLIAGLVAMTIWNAPYKNFNSKIAAIPMMFIVMFAFIGCSIWTMAYSLTDAKILPVWHYIGFKQYTRLFAAEVWQVSWHNALIYLVLGTFGSFTGGFLLAVFMDQKVRMEGLFRTIYLYPFALSFIVTGHVWAWIFSPAYGLEHSIRQMGWTDFNFAWISTQDMAIYCVVIAGLWQGTGLVMALMLAGLRGIDDEIWKASKIDGIPKWRTYMSIVIPMMRPVLVTTFVIVASGGVRVYDIVVALTDGGPGVSTNVPAYYVYKYLFGGSIGQGLAASTIMLLVSAVILIPWVYVEFVKNKQNR